MKILKVQIATIIFLFEKKRLIPLIPAFAINYKNLVIYCKTFKDQ